VDRSGWVNLDGELRGWEEDELEEEEGDMV
jgi:hypothetical protein